MAEENNSTGTARLLHELTEYTKRSPKPIRKARSRFARLYYLVE